LLKWCISFEFGKLFEPNVISFALLIFFVEFQPLLAVYFQILQVIVVYIHECMVLCRFYRVVRPRHQCDHFDGDICVGPCSVLCSIQRKARLIQLRQSKSIKIIVFDDKYCEIIAFGWNLSQFSTMPFFISTFLHKIH